MLHERHYAPEAIQSRLQEMEELWEELLASCQGKWTKLQDAYKVIQGCQWLDLGVVSRDSTAALLYVLPTSVSLDTVQPDSSRPVVQRNYYVEWNWQENWRSLWREKDL